MQAHARRFKLPLYKLRRKGAIDHTGSPLEEKRKEKKRINNLKDGIDRKLFESSYL